MDLNVLRKIGAMNMTRSKINTLSSSHEDGVVIEVEVKQEEEAEAAIEGITEEEQN
jgi:nicotinate-nucleotide pyrophosphorylase